jgi:D-sedoheptulose 7-phosphate isomerase
LVTLPSFPHGELIGRYKETRRRDAQAARALALGGDVGSVTCIANDFGYGALYERQLEGLVAMGDAAVGLTTSGASENVARGIALTGSKGLVGEPADYVVAVPSDVTAHIQEVHLMLIHAWCAERDVAFVA